MLDSSSPVWAHVAQNVGLILLSIAFLPLDTSILVLSYALSYMLRIRTHEQPKANGRSRVVLVTGVGMTKGLMLARLFAKAGHRVVGADFEPDGALACGRFSRAIAIFYKLQRPKGPSASSVYSRDLLKIVKREKIDLWVSCSGVASALEDGEAKEVIESKTDCRAVQFDAEVTRKLHEKDLFMEFTASLGLRVPETHVAQDVEDIKRILASTPDKTFLMKSIALNDASRGNMTQLPLATQEKTLAYLRHKQVVQSYPWLLQEYIRGPEYCTHALIVSGVVRAFVACPSLELLMHYEALNATDPLSRAMLNFTRDFASKAGRDFTGHLSFDFIIRNPRELNVEKVQLYPIECNPRAHTAVALFNKNIELVDAYLEVTSPVTFEQELSDTGIIQPSSPSKYYWVGHDLVDSVGISVLRVIQGQISVVDAFTCNAAFIERLLFWKDGTFDLQDPLPWWWLYHAYWPMRFLNSLLSGRRWSRINVSTTKIFEC
ncbi:MAG: hypothetical protein M1828_000167 [Chrysothrix sp. TS-e1954]|nr:MAG: hypothetical protein M1828_000167 [Chrysothrix sp. TS-e1954]